MCDEQVFRMAEEAMQLMDHIDELTAIAGMSSREELFGYYYRYRDEHEHAESLFDGNPDQEYDGDVDPMEDVMAELEEAHQLASRPTPAPPLPPSGNRQQKPQPPLPTEVHPRNPGAYIQQNQRMQREQFKAEKAISRVFNPNDVPHPDSKKKKGAYRAEPREAHWFRAKNGKMINTAWFGKGQKRAPMHPVSSYNARYKKRATPMTIASSSRRGPSFGSMGNDFAAEDRRQEARENAAASRGGGPGMGKPVTGAWRGI